MHGVVLHAFYLEASGLSVMPGRHFQSPSWNHDTYDVLSMFYRGSKINKNNPDHLLKISWSPTFQISKFPGFQVPTNLAWAAWAGLGPGWAGGLEAGAGLGLGQWQEGLGLKRLNMLG